MSAERYNPEEDDSEDEGESLPVIGKTDKEREQLTHAVKNILLFRTLDDEQRMTVIDAMTEKTVSTGLLPFVTHVCNVVKVKAIFLFILVAISH